MILDRASIPFENTPTFSNVLFFYFLFNKFSQIITEICFNVLNYLNYFYIYISYILYILTYTYANVLNYILFYSILTNILCMFYVPFSIAMIAQSEKKNILLLYIHILFILYSLHVFYMFYCCHFKYSVCFLCFMYRCFTLVCQKIAQMS